MLAFEVEIDGEPTACAGVEDWAVLGLNISAVRDKREGGCDDLHLHLGGLTLPDRDGVSHHVRWGGAETSLEIGAKIRVRIVDTDAVDPPARRYRSDSEVQESPYTEDEMRDLRYQSYLELKREFEQDVAD